MAFAQRLLLGGLLAQPVIVQANNMSNMSGANPSPAPPTAAPTGPPTAAPATTVDIAAFTVTDTMKCLWRPDRHECGIEWKNYPTSNPNSEIAKFVQWQVDKKACAVKAKADCTGSCMYEDGRCRHGEEWKEYEKSGRTSTGCTHRHYTMVELEPCKRTTTEDDCNNKAHCYYDEPDTTPAPTPPMTPMPTTLAYSWSDTAMMCLVRDQSSSSESRCKESTFKRVCGANSNATFEKEGPNVMRAMYVIWSCGASMTDDAALKLCLEGIGMCSSMVSDTNLPAWKKKINQQTMTADETKQLDDVTKACYASQFCDAYANLEFKGSSELDCDGMNTDETQCKAKTGCVWLTAGTGANVETMCMSPKQMREDFDADTLGDDSCWGTKVQKVQGKAGLTDDMLKTKMQEDRTKELDCRAKTDMAQCTAPCAIKKRTDVSCDAMGDIKGTNRPDECDYDEEAQMTAAKLAGLWGAYTPIVSAQNMEAVVAIDSSCKAHADRAACDAAVYSAAEKATVTTAESTGVASGASYTDPTRNVVMMILGFLAVFVFGM